MYLYIVWCGKPVCQTKLYTDSSSGSTHLSVLYFMLFVCVFGKKGERIFAIFFVFKWTHQIPHNLAVCVGTFFALVFRFVCCWCCSYLLCSAMTAECSVVLVCSVHIRCQLSSYTKFVVLSSNNQRSNKKRALSLWKQPKIEEEKKTQHTKMAKPLEKKLWIAKKNERDKDANILL